MPSSPSGPLLSTFGPGWSSDSSQLRTSVEATIREGYILTHPRSIAPQQHPISRDWFIRRPKCPALLPLFATLKSCLHDRLPDTIERDLHWKFRLVDALLSPPTLPDKCPLTLNLRGIQKQLEIGENIHGLLSHDSHYSYQQRPDTKCLNSKSFL